MSTSILVIYAQLDTIIIHQVFSQYVVHAPALSQDAYYVTKIQQQ